jgi:hypothetical protein
MYCVLIVGEDHVSACGRQVGMLLDKENSGEAGGDCGQGQLTRRSNQRFPTVAQQYSFFYSEGCLSQELIDHKERHIT